MVWLAHLLFGTGIICVLLVKCLLLLVAAILFFNKTFNSAQIFFNGHKNKRINKINNMDDIENPQQEEKKGCCANSCFGDCNPCKKKDKELEYDSDTDKGEQPKEDLNFKETLKASEAHCRYVFFVITFYMRSVKKTGRRPRDW